MGRIFFAFFIGVCGVFVSIFMKKGGEVGCVFLCWVCVRKGEIYNIKDKMN